MNQGLLKRKVLGMLKQIIEPVLKSLFRISIILEVINGSSRGVWG